MLLLHALGLLFVSASEVCEVGVQLILVEVLGHAHHAAEDVDVALVVVTSRMSLLL